MFDIGPDPVISTAFGAPLQPSLPDDHDPNTGDKGDGSTSYGIEELRFTTLRSQRFGGAYGRLFPSLPPWEPRPVPRPIRPLTEPDAAYPPAILELAKHSFPAGGGAKRINADIPAGYTLLGQFMVHDLTFDPTTIHQRQRDPERLVNFRTPRLDLDSVYGGGPDQSPYLYEKDDPHYFLIGRTDEGRADLPRNEEGRALIPDPRNDSNTLISQLHLAFLLFHNAQMDALATRGIRGARAFDEAQRATRWHFQWLVLEDWLGHLTGALGRPDLPHRMPCNPHAILQRLRTSPDRFRRSGPLGFYQWSDAPKIPVEFAVAVARVGHAMVTDWYRLNEKTNLNLRCFRPFRPLVDANRIDWSYFARPSWRLNSKAQASGRLEVRIASGLAELRDGRGPRNLAERDLIRSYQLGLPSGQDVEACLGIQEDNYPGSDPLWYQLLQWSGSTRRGDKPHGRFVSRATCVILCEVLFGLVLADESSFLRAEPTWMPCRTGGEYWGLLHFIEAGQRHELRRPLTP